MARALFDLFLVASFFGAATPVLADRPHAPLQAIESAPNGGESGRAERFERLHEVAEDRRVVRVDGDPSELASLGFDVARHGTENRGDPVDIVAGPRELERLADLGYLVHPGPLEFEVPTVEDWSDFDEIQSRIDALVTSNSTIMNPILIGSSLEGRPIRTIRVSANAAVEDPSKPKVAFNGAHHAREVMTVEAAVDILSQIAERHHADDAQVTKWLDGLEIYITPIANPDGYQYVHSDDTWWRKNRRENSDGSHGVDLNRNYPYAWGANNSGSSGHPGSETYRGASAMSEPETQAMVGLARKIRPVFNLSYHSYGEVLLFPYGYENAQDPVGDIISTLAEEISSRMIRDSGDGHFEKRSRLYPVNGLDRDWYYYELGTYSFVPEISNSWRGFHPEASWVEPTVTGLRPAWSWILDRTLGPGIRGNLVDAATGESRVGEVRLKEVAWRNGEPRVSSADGWFQFVTEPGTYHVLATVDGYQAVEVPVDVGEEGLSTITISLEPVPSPAPSPAP